MKIAKNKVVSIDYTLKDDDGKIIDSSEGRDPLSYIQGIGNIIPGLEEALEGKESGSKINVSIEPEKGYGVRNENMIKQLERSQFEPDMEIKTGMQFQAEGPEGLQVVVVTNVENDTITVDGNHPLAGMQLNFSVEVKDIRDATEEELSHGHVHGPGGHHH